jgi:hypothetical protein
MKGSQDIERTSSGLQTYTDRPTDRCKAICPSYIDSSKGGIKNPTQTKTKNKTKTNHEN